jgi:hypothetical protein
MSADIRKILGSLDARIAHLNGLGNRKLLRRKQEATEIGG